jgi:phenylalanyl-tRNA synthetase beta chain
VCGASNFAEGDTVAVVLPGATLPGGETMGTAKLRGVESFGMMLSERELELSTDHSGIMLLPGELTPGDELYQHVPLGDTVIELEITPNRPDCLGVAGVARELAAAARVDFRDPFASDDAVADPAAGTIADLVHVSLDAADLCSRYLARGFVDVAVGQSPAWLKARLAAAGMRAINNVVDVTNYVMLLTGQPLHAFDADALRGNKLVVRNAHPGEKVTTLDGVERTLEPWMLSIADAEQTAVIAGIFGAEDAEVSDTTKRIVLEAACFDGPTLQQTSVKLGIRSESSARFEKGLDPWLPEVALKLASKLLVDVCGARMVAGTVDEHGTSMPQPPTIELEAALPGRIIGVDITAERIEDTLFRLGYPLSQTASGWKVDVPHWRMFDTTRPIDLVEEIARLIPDEEIPATLPSRIGAAPGGLTAMQRFQRVLEDVGTGLGFHETVTYSLLPGASNEAFDVPKGDVVRLNNPLTKDHVELRGTMLPSLLEVAQRNRAVGDEDVSIFEIGPVFRSVQTDSVSADGFPVYADERRVLGVLATGQRRAGRLGSGSVQADLWSVAGDLSAWLAVAGAPIRLAPFDAPPAYLHPGQAARVVLAGSDPVDVGWIATVHPRLSGERGLRQDAVAAELDMTLLAQAASGTAAFQPVSSFPPVVQDIAVIVKDETRAGDLVAVAEVAGSPLIESVAVFDRYEGDELGEGHHSVALRLTFRASDRTLTDEEINAVRDGVVAALGTQLGARVREGNS